MTLPTLQDVCRLAGTSDATASMILNGRQAHKFRPETRERVLRAARELGYVAQRAGQTLRTGKSLNIALLLNELTNPFFGRYASILQGELLGRGYMAIPLETHADNGSERAWLGSLMQRNVDGLIDLQGMLQSDSEAYDRFAERAPVVIRSPGVLPAGVRGHVVRVDYRPGLNELARHLAETGRRSPGVLTVEKHLPGCATGGRDTNWTQMCVRSFEQAGIPVAEEHWFDGGSEADMGSWYRATRSLAASGAKIDCLLVHNASLVPAVLEGLRESGWEVGARLALATFDDPPEMSCLCGGVTTIREPVEEIARQLVEGLFGRMSDPRQPGVQVNVRAELVVRSSTAGSPGWLELPGSFGAGAERPVKAIRVIGRSGRRVAGRAVVS